MSSSRRFSLRIAFLFILAGLSLFLLYLYFFVPFGSIVDAIQKANPLYLMLAFGLLFLGVAFSSMAWQRLLKVLSVRVSLLKAYQLTWIASFVDILIPAESISGDVSRIYLMSREAKESEGRVVASVVSQRILGLLVTVVSLLISGTYYVVNYSPPLLALEVVVIVEAGGLLTLGLLLYVSVTKGATEKIADWLIRILMRVFRGRWKFRQLRERAVKFLNTFHEGIWTLGEQRSGLILPLIFTVLAWFSDVLIAVLVFLSLGSFGVTISLSAIVVVYSISIAIEDIPVGVPWEIGTVEIVMTNLFALLGSPNLIGVFAVATFLIRVLTVWVRMLVGGLMVQLLGIKGVLTSTRS
jgi:uncharacterized protein (TIRG00374 family)